MTITKNKLRRIIKEEVIKEAWSASPKEPRKSTDLDAARDAGRSRDQIGRVEAIKLLRHLEDMGYVSSRGAVTQLIEFLQTLEQNEDIRHGGWDE